MLTLGRGQRTYGDIFAQRISAANGAGENGFDLGRCGPDIGRDSATPHDAEPGLCRIDAGSTGSKTAAARRQARAKEKTEDNRQAQNARRADVVGTGLGAAIALAGTDTNSGAALIREWRRFAAIFLTRRAGSRSAGGFVFRSVDTLPGAPYTLANHGAVSGLSWIASGPGA